MDPAHANQALSAQGAAIRQLHQDMLEIGQELTALRQPVSALQAPALPVVAPAVRVALSCDSYPYDLEPFDSNLDQCTGFLLQCRLVFSQWSRLFPTDESKKNFVIGLHRGRALRWARASSSGACLTRSRLRSLWSVLNAYSIVPTTWVVQPIDFSLSVMGISLWLSMRWNSESYRPSRAGMRRLCGALLVEVLPIGYGTRLGTLNELIDRAIEIDNYQRERPHERSFRFKPPRPLTRSRLSPLRAPPPPLGQKIEPISACRRAGGLTLILRFTYAGRPRGGPVMRGCHCLC